MLIRINLLPVRQVLKQQQGRRELAAYALLFVLVCLANALVYYQLENQVKNRTAVVARLNEEINEVKKTLGKAEDLKRRKREIEKKLETYEELRKGRSGPVRMLDALAKVWPKKVVLREFLEDNNKVRMTGQAATQGDVAEMIRALTNVVWTPRGLGRLIERKKDGVTVRVELYSSEGASFDFKTNEVGNFFTDINLRNSQLVDSTSGMFAFEIFFTANYAI